MNSKHFLVILLAVCATECYQAHAALEVIVATGRGLSTSDYTRPDGIVKDTSWKITSLPSGEQTSIDPIVESPRDYWAPQTIPYTHFIKPPPSSATDYFNQPKGDYRYETRFILSGALSWNLYLNAFADDSASVYIDKVDPVNLVFQPPSWSEVVAGLEYPSELELGANMGPLIGETNSRFYTKLLNSDLLTAGEHTLIVTVNNVGHGQTGFDLQACFVAVPEPSTWFEGLAALGMLGYYGVSNAARHRLFRRN